MSKSSAYVRLGLFFVLCLALSAGPVCLATEPDGAKGDESAEKPTDTKELKNTLKWTTASEVENFGFDIFRGEAEDGPFAKVTEDPIPGAGTVDEPQHYVWEDRDIERGKDYYYYIESISMSGVRERFSPIIKAAAK